MIKEAYVGEHVELYQFNFIRLGGGVLNITNNASSNDIVWFDTVWNPNPVRIQGLRGSAGGSLPTPEINVSNLTGLFTQQLLLTRDLIGGIITRYIIDSSSLGTSEEPIKNPDVFMINNTQRNEREINLSCTTQLGTWDVELPSKHMLIRDYPGLGRVY
ncbi:phage minor tail protein L [Vibrio astriarenae]|uniref:hypothetical protein n=1 Tax=Vibrio astriarenae TaxID=1481923 RepID=UPI0037366FBA